MTTRRASTFRRPPRWLASHEAGHIVARLALNDAYGHGPMVKGFDLMPADPAFLGMAMQDARVSALAPVHPAFAIETRRAAYLDALEDLAGPLAELRERRATAPAAALAIADALESAQDIGQLGGPNDFSMARLKLDLAAGGAWRLLMWEAIDLAQMIVARSWPAIREIGGHMQGAVSGGQDALYALWSKVQPARVPCYRSRLFVTLAALKPAE